MKNVFPVRLKAILITCFGFFTLTLQAERGEEESLVQVIKACHVEVGPGFSTPNTCPSNTLPVELNEAGELTITAQIRVTYLSQINSNGDFLLPANTPDIYLHLSNKDEGLSVMVGPFEHFAYNPSVQPTADLLYHSRIETTLDLSGFICKGLNGINTIKTTDLKIEMMTPLHDGSGDYEIYPIHDFSSPGDIFTCSTFQETCFDCNNTNCPTLEDPIYHEIICFDCEVEKDEFSLRRELKTDNNDISLISHLTPNPFNQNVELRLEGVKSLEVIVEIYNSNGQLIHNELISRDSDTQNINTHILVPGLYFFHIKDGNHSSFHKLLKSNF